MAIAKFQLPDGRIARFEVPEGTTPEQAQLLIEQQLATMEQAPTEVFDVQTEGGRGVQIDVTVPTMDRTSITETADVAEEPVQGRGFLGTLSDIGSGVAEAVTGSERETETIRAMPEWTQMPELNSPTFRSALTGLGTLLANPDEIAKVVQSNFPDTEVFQDEKGNFIFRSSLDGRDYAIKPGFRVSDIPRAAAGFAAFTPAGRATTIRGAGAGAAATQALIEATQMAAGGELDVGEVGIAGATGAAFPAALRTVQAGRTALRGQPAAPGAPDMPPGATPPAAAAPTGQSKTATLFDDWVQKSRAGDQGTKDVFSAISRRAQAAPDVDFELRLVKTSDVFPTQVGDDYLNASSMETARKIASSNTIQQIDRVEDVLPIRLDQDMRIIDGNHRHAAAVLNQDEFIQALVPVGKGTGKVVNIDAIKQGTPIAGRVEAPMPAATPGAAAAPGAADAMTSEELVGATLRAGEPSRIPGRQTRAMDVLAGETAPDPKVVAAARRLGIDEFLQPDHVTTNQVYRELAQAVKSIPGSEARRAELQGLERVAKRANDLIDEIGGTRDYSTLGANVQSRMQREVDQLADAAEDLYKNSINKAIPKRVEVNAENILNYIRTRADDLGGFQNLSSMEKEIFGKLAPRAVKVDGVDVQKLPTYALLDDVRKDIGSAYKQAGPFKDSDRAALDRIYGLLSEDQMSVAAQFGADGALRSANALVRMRKGVEDDMRALFGKQLHQSMVSKIDKTMKALSKGDEKQLIELLKSVPKDMRPEVVASGLKTAFGRASMDRPISFNDYATWYQGLLENRRAYAALMTHLPQESRKQLSDLYRVSNSIAKASRERIQTGRIQAVTDQLKNADSLIGGIIGAAQKGAVITTMETGARALGVPGAGVAAWAATALSKDKTSRQKVADSVLASPEFLRASKLIAEGQAEAGANVLARSRVFSRYAKEMGIPQEMNAKAQWILSTMQTERQLADEPLATD